MTTTWQQIEDLDVDTWAAVTRRVAVDALAAAKRFGKRPPAELVAVAAMTERELVEHRKRSGPARKRPSPVMQLLEADHLRAVAEGRARDAHQDKQDAEAAASIARAEAAEHARATTTARERARAVETDAKRKEVERAAERAGTDEALRQLHNELAQARAHPAPALAAAGEKVRAAEARAEQCAGERAEERAVAEKALQEVRGTVERVRADAAAEVAALREQARAAEVRAAQRAAERAEERAAAEETVQRVRTELEQVRAYAAAEVAAARGQANGEVAAVRKAAEAEVAWARAEAENAFHQAGAEVAAARQAAAAEVAQARAEADTAHRDAQAALMRAAATNLLTIPIPPVQVRAEARRIENALTALNEIDYMLEVGVVEAVESQIPRNTELMRNLVWTMQREARDLSLELGNMPTRYSNQLQVEAAASYANAVRGTYRELLQRIETAAQRLGGRRRRSDAEILEAVFRMLADPWVQDMRNQSS
jgi:hypothetical protein